MFMLIQVLRMTVGDDLMLNIRPQLLKWWIVLFWCHIPLELEASNVLLLLFFMSNPLYFLHQTRFSCNTWYPNFENKSPKTTIFSLKQVPMPLFITFFTFLANLTHFFHHKRIKVWEFTFEILKKQPAPSSRVASHG